MIRICVLESTVLELRELYRPDPEQLMIKYNIVKSTGAAMLGHHCGL